MGKKKIVEKEIKADEIKSEQIIQPEKLSDSMIERFGSDVFVESAETPDDFKEFPKFVVCTTDPKNYAYPMLLKFDTCDIVRIQVMNKYVPCALRLIDLFKWCVDVRVKRKRVSTQIKTNKNIIVNEYVLHKIPACRS